MPDFSHMNILGFLTFAIGVVVRIDPATRRPGDPATRRPGLHGRSACRLTESLRGSPGLMRGPDWAGRTCPPRRRDDIAPGDVYPPCPNAAAQARPLLLRPAPPYRRAASSCMSSTEVKVR